MASVAEICNAGLSHLGAEASITSIDPPDGTAEAGYCKTFYPIARRELLELGNWSFSLRRVALAEVANASTVWRHAYALPAGCMTPLRVLPLEGLDTRDLTAATQEGERGSALFSVEGDVLFTHEPTAVLVYTVDVTDSGRFPALFVSALGYLMASYLAGPIIKGTDGAKAGQTFRQQAMQMASAAIVADANGGSEAADVLPDMVAVRQ